MLKYVELRNIIYIYIKIKIIKYVYKKILIKKNKINIKLKGLDMYFLNLNYLKLNYLFFLLNIKVFIFKRLNKNIITLNSSHISNIKSKEQFSIIFIRSDYYFNICKFFINFLNYKLFKVLLLNLINVNLKNITKVIYFIN